MTFSPPTPPVAPDDRLHLGASWYPEMWPEAEWAGDVARMQEVGFTLIRLFEFAWKRLEPQEGVFDFGWARRVLDLLHEAGIQAMIGTPTAAPPAWLTFAHPEVLGISASGKRDVHGKRKHYNPHSVEYRRHARRIVSAMVRELGDHPAVHSWQIDNEMSGFDYGPETTVHFRDWLRQRYGTIENLNQTWGLDFWSQAYESFDQVALVTADYGSRDVPERHHPSLIVAVARFQNEGWSSFMAEQAEEIRQGGRPVPVTTNMTGSVGAMDWWKHFRPLDRVGASMYADLSYYHYNYFRFDRLRAEKEQPFWLIETAPNWSGGGPVWNIHHDSRGIRAFTWMNILVGGSMVLYWQWRSHWAGQEMQHGTCVSQTGRWMPGKETWAELGRDFARLGSYLIDHPVPQAPIALLASCESSWVFAIDPIDNENRYEVRIRDDYHLPLVRAHWFRDVIHPEASFEGYRVIVAPHLPILSPAVRERLVAWVEAGGRLLLGPLSGYRSEENTLFTEQEFGGLEDLIGANQALRFSPHWVEQSINIEFADGNVCHPRFWCDAWEPGAETEVLARYRGGYGDGLAAVVARRCGEGKVIAVGCPLDETCYLALVADLAGEAGVTPMAEDGEGVLVIPRTGKDGVPVAYGVVNTRKEARTVRLQAGGKDLINGEDVEASVVLEPLQVRLVSVPHPSA